MVVVVVVVAAAVAVGVVGVGVAVVVAVALLGNNSTSKEVEKLVSGANSTNQHRPEEPTWKQQQR